MTKGFMYSRRQQLLTYIIEAHIKTAEPVGSSLIAEKYMKEVSSPTVRNDMQELERQGLITQPHTSAGRIPTEQGYRNYIENLGPKDISEKHRHEIDEARRISKDPLEKVKNVAKKAAEVSGSAAVIAFSKHDVYYTGLSNLFSKPEFSRQNIVVDMSEVIDHLDEVMSRLSDALGSEVSVLLGSDNPFGSGCASVLTKSDSGMVFGLLGPLRMDYEKNIGLVKYIKNLI